MLIDVKFSLSWIDYNLIMRKYFYTSNKKVENLAFIKNLIITKSMRNKIWILDVISSGPLEYSIFWTLFWEMSYCCPLTRTDLVQKWTSLLRKITRSEPKSICFLETEWFILDQNLVWPRRCYESWHWSLRRLQYCKLWRIQNSRVRWRNIKYYFFNFIKLFITRLINLKYIR